MNGKGPLITFTIGLLLATIFFGIYGFSYDGVVRWGQYCGLLLISYCCLEEILKL